MYIDKTIMSFLLTSVICVANAQEEEPKPLSKTESLKVLTAGADTFEIALEKDDKELEPVERFEKPIYRYTDPSRKFQDGTVWAWGKKGRPIALATVTQDGRPDKLITETIILADAPVSFLFNNNGQQRIPFRSDKDAKYSAQMKTMDVVPGKGASKSILASQAKLLARRFKAHEIWNNDRKTEDRRYQLRLLSKPIHQYEDEKTEILHGSIFLFNYGSNPELGLVLEAYKEGWKCGFFRLGHAAATVELDGKEFYSHPWFSGRNPHYIFSGISKPNLN